MRTLKIYSVSNFQTYNRILLIIVTMMYIISPGLIYFIIRSFYFLTISTDFTQHLPSHLWQPPICSLYLWVQFCFFIFFQIPHMNDIIWHLSFSVWLISLSIMISRSICVVTNAGSPPFNGWIIVQCLFIHIYSTFFLIHSSIDGHLGCFHTLTLEDNAAVNRECRYFFCILFSFPLNIYPAVGLVNHMVVLFLSLWRTTILNFQVF